MSASAESASTLNGKTEEDEYVNDNRHILKSTELCRRLSEFGLDSLGQVLNLTKSVIAGSFPLQCVLFEPWGTSDIDIFCRHTHDFQLLDKFMSSLDHVTSVAQLKDRQYVNAWTINNYCVRYGEDQSIIVQIIVTYHYDVMTYLDLDFDFDVCKVYYDGINVMSSCHPQKIITKHAVLCINDTTYKPRQSADREIGRFADAEDNRMKARLGKYQKRGFIIDTIAGPNNPGWDDYDRHLYDDDTHIADPEVLEQFLAGLKECGLDQLPEILVKHNSYICGFNLYRVLIMDSSSEDESTIDIPAYVQIITNNRMALFADLRTIPNYTEGLITVPVTQDFGIMGRERRHDMDRIYDGGLLPTSKNHNELTIIVEGMTGSHIKFVHSLLVDIEKIWFDGVHLKSICPWEKIMARVGTLNQAWNEQDRTFKYYDLTNVKRYYRKFGVKIITDDISPLVKSALKR